MNIAEFLLVGGAIAFLVAGIYHAVKKLRSQIKKDYEDM